LTSRAVLIFRILTTLVTCWACGSAARANQVDGVYPVPIQNVPAFSDVRAQLQALVNTFGFHTVNNFCVVAYAGPKGDNSVLPYVYWPTQNKLIEWGIGSNLILGSNHYFDLTRDVVPDGAISIDSLTRADVDSVLQDCRRYGNKFTITKTSGDWVPISQLPQFSSVIAQLQDLVDSNGPPGRNSFCVIGQKDGSFLGAYVYWQTADRLIFWYPTPHDLGALTYSEVQIDLKHGLRNEEDADDDRNEMQRSYAEAVIRACRTSGKNFLINKSN